MYIDGPFAIYTGEIDPSLTSDAIIYRTLKWGYDTYEQALADVRSVAEEEGVPLRELAIVCVTNIADITDEMEVLEGFTAPEK